MGGVQLPLALAELGLIDEYEFVVHPKLAGHGPTLFAGLSKHVDLRLMSRVEFGSGGCDALRAKKIAIGPVRPNQPSWESPTKTSKIVREQFPSLHLSWRGTPDYQPQRQSDLAESRRLGDSKGGALILWEQCADQAQRNPGEAPDCQPHTEQARQEPGSVHE